MTVQLPSAPNGLEGVVVTDTALGDVLGAEGSFHYRGYDAPQLARHRSLEEVWHLLLVGDLPGPDEHAGFVERVREARARVPRSLLDQPTATAPGTTPRAGDQLARLRTAWSRLAEHLDCRPWGDTDTATRLDQAIALAAAAPPLIAATMRGDVADHLDELPEGTPAAYLQLLHGAPPDPRHVAALERYLILTIDHGLNASTFTARTVTSTGADLGAVVVAALGALSGPLHGGAPSRALEMLDAIATPDRAEAWVRDALGRGERIMGFGHRVYRTEDPRAALLRETARELGGERIDLALHVEDVVRRLLRETKPDRVLDVNVEYHAAVVLEAVGIPPTLFTPTFALSRVIGWTAHALEQMQGNRIVRPSARYVGPPPPRPMP